MYLISMILQIIFESLPISSSGHMQMLHMSMPEYLDRLSVGPTLIMLACYFYKEIIAILLDIRSRASWILSWGVCLGSATLVTVFLYELINYLLLENIIAFPLWIGFGLTACMLFSLKWCIYNNETRPQFLKLLLIGFAQGCARLPGVSRLGTTYTVACWLGFSPYRAFRISCALQAPLFFAGFLQGFVKAWSLGELVIPLPYIAFAGIVVATVIAYFLLWLVEVLMVQRKIWCVGWYMLLVTLVSFFVDYLEFFKFLLVG